MKIAVMLGGVGFDSQQRIIKGILDKALADRNNVFIFAGEVWDHWDAAKYEVGEYNIYMLPDYSKYDGVIINEDTIHNKVIGEYMVQKIKESGTPCVSIDIDYPEFMYVEMESRKGMSAIVEHIIVKHNARNIYFISGPKNNHDGTERLEAYKEVVLSHQLPFDKNHVYYGSYTFESGKNAAIEFLKKGLSKPDAIVAANDEMAVGATIALREAGYRVPEDVIVTGYDDSVTASYHYPRITTVKRGEYDAGVTAYEMIKAVVNGEKVERSITIQGVPVYGGSCGCTHLDSLDTLKLRSDFINMRVENLWNLELIKSSAAEFTGLSSFEEFLTCLEHYIRYIDMDYFYLCTCGNEQEYNEEIDRIAAGLENPQDTTVYREKMLVPFAYEKGVVSKYGAFQKGDLLPPDCKMQREGAFYLVMPIHFQDFCYGYCIVGNYMTAIDSRYYHNFVLNLDNALETIHKQDIMRSMLKRLNVMWKNDELTGVYNRAGFRSVAYDMMKDARLQDTSIGVIFVDLDGLKKVNDHYGHEEGDVLIKAMATVLQQTIGAGEVLGRFGGDEYVILTSGCTEIAVRDEVDRIQKAITDYNLLHLHPFELSASIGFHYEANANNTELEEMIELADQDMYRVKRAKKKSR